METQALAKVLLGVGGVFLFFGLLLYWFPQIFSFFGKLPGDVAYKGENFQVYFPWVTSLVLSIICSLGFYLFRKFFG